MENNVSTTGLHTVLGAGGASGKAIIAELLQKSLAVRAVQRSSFTMKGVECVNATLLDQEETKKAIDGSTHVYMCAAVEYKTRSWQHDWPLMMDNIIKACLYADAVLVFLDNIYMYGPAPLTIPFDEKHTQLPPSKKGMVRKQVADMVEKAITDQNLKAVIARSADFYGPYAKNSMLYIQTLDRMMAGKGPNSIATPGIRHTYGNTTDNARAMVLLAKHPDCYGQVWHLPVGDAITPEQIVQLINKALNTSFKPSFIPTFIKAILRVLIPVMKEAGEMEYQFDNEYIMSWDKFKKRFPDFRVTPYEKGIAEMIASFK